LEFIPTIIGQTTPYSINVDCFDEVPFLADAAKQKSSQTGRRLRGRDGPYPIGCAAYLDAETCSRNLGRTPPEVARALAASLPAAKLFETGVLIVCSDDYPPPGRAIETDSRIRQLVGAHA
jgi:hypothetical protein